MQNQVYIGTGKVGPRLYLCVIMDYESRMIIGYDFGSTNSDKLKQRLCQSRGIQTVPPKSRYVSSFFSALSAEQMMRYRFHDNEERKAAVEDYIEFYNEERIHSSLGYKTPFEVYSRNHFHVVTINSEK
ncbi:MAG: integrase core domain-containing protein [Spirochaetales bacterium]|nr:integrase core domain-containing protein [Spirochaetales bacterium]